MGQGEAEQRISGSGKGVFLALIPSSTNTEMLEDYWKPTTESLREGILAKLALLGAHLSIMLRFLRNFLSTSYGKEFFFYTENTSMCFELGNRLQNEESDNWQKNKNKKQTSEMVKESFNIWAFVVVAFSKIKDTFENISLKIILDWS